MRDHIFLPKPKGVKKGWIRHIGAISQNRFLVFPFSEKVRKLFNTVQKCSRMFKGPSHDKIIFRIRI